MDQGGLKHNGNRDGSLTFGEAGGRLGGDPGDPAALLLQPAVHLPGLGSLPPSTMVSSAGPGEDQLELGGFFLSDVKESKERMQKPPDLGLFSLESSLLKPSVPDSTSIITTSDTSVLVNLPLPDLFPQHIKQEETFSLDKALDAFGRNPAVGPSDLDSNSNHLLDDPAIWKDLDLPYSLPEMTGFELEDEVDKILDQCKSSGTSVSAFPKDVKSGSDDGINCPNLNGTKHPVQHQPLQLQPLQPQQLQLQPQQLQLQPQQQLQPQLLPQPLQPEPLLSSITIKVKKDPDPSFIHMPTAVEVKLEKGDGDAFCLQSSLSSGLGLGLRSGYNCRANLASGVGLQDQKPFCLYPTLPVSAESWSAGGRLGDSAGGPRADDGGPSTTLLGTFPSSFSR